jgi:hypothetical protein
MCNELMMYEAQMQTDTYISLGAYLFYITLLMSVQSSVSKSTIIGLQYD